MQYFSITYSCQLTILFHIRLDSNGIVTRVNYSNQQRDSVFQAESVNEVKALYKALILFDRLIYKKENHIVYKLEQGET